MLAAAGLLLSGCGSPTGPPDGQAEPSSPSDAEQHPRTELTVERAVSDPDAPAGLDGFSPGVWTLTCEPAGGDHPDPEAACAALAEAGVDVFAPVPEDQPCTLVYGGPETATVTGHVAGTPVDAEFSRENGCEIDRWERVGPLLHP